jgi:hypothetical protein
VCVCLSLYQCVYVCVCLSVCLCISVYACVGVCVCILDCVCVCNGERKASFCVFVMLRTQDH